MIGFTTRNRNSSTEAPAGRLPIPPSERAASPGLPVHAALFAAQAGFALFPILGKLALASMPAFVLAALRVVCAAGFLEAIRRSAGDRGIAAPDRRLVMLCALLGVSLNQCFFILGLSMTTAVNTSILTATIPIFTMAIAGALGRERLAFATGLGTALATAGVLVLLDVTRFDLASTHVRGNLLILANALCYSAYLVLSRPLLARYSARTVVSRVFLYGAGPILLAALPALGRFSPRTVTPLSWSSLAGIVVLATVLPYLGNSWALGRTEASKVAFYVFLQPLMSSALAVAILGEAWSGRATVAAVLILAGLAVAVGRRPAASPAARGSV